MAISKRTRFEVLRRDNHTCRYCNATDSPLTVDHVTPVALGGSDRPDNLVAACKDCNAGKSSASPDAATVAGVADDAARWASAMRQAALQLTAETDAEESYLGEFVGTWSGYLPSTWEGSISALYRAGLPLSEMLSAIRIAESARGLDNRFRYFCGVSWKKLARIQEIAKTLVPDLSEGDEDEDDAIAETDQAWLDGYDVALARYQSFDVYAQMLSSVIDVLPTNPFGKPVWHSDLHPRQLV